MRVGAIIAEFNPLHRGHLYLIHEAKKKCDLLIVLLSGYFSQRGEPVCQDKWIRARDTIDAGADLVLTHPVYSATSAATEFAEGAISIISKLPFIQYLFFGLEETGMDVYFKGLDLLENSSDYEDYLKKFLNQGNSYSVSMREALTAINPELIDLFQPNTILGLEYGKSLRSHNLIHLAHPIPRISSIDGRTFPSASKLRADYNMGKAECNCTFQYNRANMISTKKLEDELYQLYRGKLISETLDFTPYLGYEIGIESRLKHQSIHATESNDFFQSAKTKRYSVPRLKRLLLHSYLNLTKEKIHAYNRSVKTVQVLGFNHKGQSYLKKCHNLEGLHLITNYRQLDDYSNVAQTTYQMEIRASNLYHLLTRSKLNQDMLKHPYIKKS